MRVEVLGEVERRRRWSQDDKVRIVEETLVPGAKVTEVARRNGIAASVVFTWRRQARTVEKVGPCFASVQIAAAETSEQAVKVVPEDGSRGRSVAVARVGLIEIVLQIKQLPAAVFASAVGMWATRLRCPSGRSGGFERPFDRIGGQGTWPAGFRVAALG
jgi:transposase